MVAKLLKSEAALIDRVVGAGDPNGAAGLQDPPTCLYPGDVEVEVAFDTLTLIPVALVHTDHLASLASNSAVRKIVWRVSKNQIDAFRLDLVQDFEAITSIEGKVVLRKIWFHTEVDALISPTVYRSKALVATSLTALH